MVKITLTLTKRELALLTSALDSHAYWELSEQDNRNNGFVLDEEHSKDLRQCNALRRKLERIAR